MSEKREFSTDESYLRDNYVGLHEATGEPFDRMADRIEEQCGDPALAAKIRSLHVAERDEAPKGRSAKPRAGKGKTETAG